MSKKEREEKLKIESDAFQRETLIELLNELDLFYEMIVKYHFHVVRKNESSENDSIIDSYIGDENSFMEVVRKRDTVYKLSQRIINDNIREDFKGLANQSKFFLKGQRTRLELESDLQIFKICTVV